MKRVALLLPLGILLAGCYADWNDVPVTLTNSGSVEEVLFVHVENGEGRGAFERRYRLAAGASVQETWELRTDDHDFHLEAYGRTLDKGVRVCAVYRGTITFNETAITLGFARGDGFTGC